MRQESWVAKIGLAGFCLVAGAFGDRHDHVARAQTPEPAACAAHGETAAQGADPLTFARVVSDATGQPAALLEITHGGTTVPCVVAALDLMAGWLQSYDAAYKALAHQRPGETSKTNPRMRTLIAAAHEIDRANEAVRSATPTAPVGAPSASSPPAAPAMSPPSPAPAPVSASRPPPIPVQPYNANPIPGQPSTLPALRLETGMHTAIVRAIASDRSGRWAATVGDDMTARVWDLATLQATRVLRPPVEFASLEIQSMGAVALSPDGGTVAVGGSVGNDWGPEANVFLFDRASGVMRHRIGIPVLGKWFSAINALRFSPDGTLLAIATSHDGFQVFDLNSGRSIGGSSRCPDYIDVAFRPDGRQLAGACAAGTGGWVSVFEVSAHGLRQIVDTNSSRNRDIPQVPASVSYSPNGQYLAIAGNTVPPRVFTADARFQLAWAPDSRGLPADQDLDVVTWSARGDLYATGTYKKGDQFQLRAWARGSKSFTDLPLGGARAFGFAPLADGRTLIAGSEPFWGIIGADTHVLEHKVPSPTLDLSHDGAQIGAGAFALSADGRIVKFGFEGGGLAPVVFEIGTGKLTARVKTTLYPVVTHTSGIHIAPDPRNGDAILLNGRSLFINKYTWGSAAPSCIAIAPDAAHFALCTRSSLLYFDASGHELWHHAAPSRFAFVANISHDRRWVVAGFADGTVRWYRAEDGEEELALFVDVDRQRWVAWTPGGYYDCSPGAEELIGWHVNRSKDAAADFYPISRFREHFYRPDVIAKLIEVGNETQAVYLANAAAPSRPVTVTVQTVLPPSVTILSPMEGSASASPEVTLRVAVRAPADAPVIGLRVRINGLPAPAMRVHDVAGAPGEEPMQDITLTLPPKDAHIDVFAENKNAVSAPAGVSLAWTGAAPPLEVSQRKPKLYLLAIGVSAYRDTDIKLAFAAEDAAAFSRSMQAQNGGMYRDVEVRLLTDTDATRDQVRSGLEWLLANTTAADYAMVLLAGHGFKDSQGSYRFAPVDFSLKSYDQTTVIYADFKQVLTTIRGTVVFFVDTCHSGSVFGDRQDNTYLVNDLSSRENGVVVLTASTGSQLSFENPAWGHGAFTKAILEGIDEGKADLPHSGRITVQGLNSYLSQRVADMTEDHQTPVIIAPAQLSNFQIAVSH